MTPAASPSSPQSPSTPLAVVNFAPLRQVIDSRMMRRLRRNHLAEEVNEIYGERRRRSKLSLQQEVDDLRKELNLTKEHGSGVSNSREMMSENGERIAELENEISSLKHEMRERSATIDAMVPQQLGEDQVFVHADSPDAVSQSSEQFLDLQDDSMMANNGIEARSPSVAVEASTQVDLPSPSLSEICRSGRLSLEYLYPGENTLGLDVTDPQPLLEAMIFRLEKLKAEMAKVEQKIAISETSKINMVNNFNTALVNLERVRGRLNELQEQHEMEKARANTADLEVSTLEARMDNMKEKCTTVEKQRDEHQRSIERLRPALEYYQSEFMELTQTIMDLEASHEDALNTLCSESADDRDATAACQQLAFEEAKSDLEAQIAAETTGRRKAEESAVERLERIKVMENRQKELQATVHEKQSIIRDLEAEIEVIKSSQEKEVGQLNVRVGELVSDISSTNAELAATRNEATRLASLVEQEKTAGLKAVQAIQSEMKKCSNTVDAVRDNHSEGVKKRGEQIAQSFGLMTPVVEGGRFRDAEADEKVEGHVQIVRGKKRPDSGVEVWGLIAEADEDEVVDGDDVLMEG